VAGEAPLDPNSRLRRDIGRHVRGAFLLAIVALTLGVVLMPRGDELLLIHVRNGDLASARRVLAESESKGGSTVSSVVAHSELFLLEGRVDEALLDLEAFVARNPRDAAALRRLSLLYQHAQRFDDEIRALAEVYRLEPTPELARQLVVLYRWAGKEADEAVRLHDLVRGGHATSAEALRSARVDAALGRRDVALATLESLAARNPEVIEYPELELLASLLVDAGKVAALGAAVQRLPVVREDPALLSQLAMTMRRWGWAAPAVHLFDTPQGSATLPALLAGRARAAQGTEVAGAVLRELMQLDTARPLAEEPREASVKLALSLGDDHAVDALLARPATPIPALVALAISDAVARDARPRAQALVSRFGDEGLAGDSPILALELAVERDDQTRALAWIQRLDAAGVSDPLEVAALAQIEVTLGRQTQAFDRLVKLVGTGSAPGWAAGDLATLGTELSRVDDTLKALAPDTRTAIEPERRRVWARLAAEHHRLDLLNAWIGSAALTPADAPALRDSYYALADCRELAAASAVAERLVALHASPDDAVLLAHALTTEGRPLDALAPLRARGLRTPEARGAYDTAVARALLAGHDRTGELRADALRRLAAERVANAPLDRRRLLVEALFAAGERASLVDEVLGLAERDLDAWLPALVESAAASGRPQDAVAVIARADGGLAALDARRRTDRVRALLELDAPDSLVLPELRRLAYEDGEGWVSVYDEHLARTARTSEQIELWTRVGQAADAPAARRRAAAARLLDLGSGSGAAAIYEELAAAAGPADPDLQQLLGLWSTTSDGRHAEWLLARLRTAPAAERAAWMAHVVTFGGAAQVAAAYPDLPMAASPALAGTWLDAHRAAGDRASFSSAVAQLIAWPDAGIDTLRHAGRVALAENLPQLAAEAYRLVAVREPDDREAVRWVGTLAFYDRRGDEAREYLKSYEALGGDEAEPLFQLGELAREDRRPSEARVFYERALARLASSVGAEKASTAERALHANVLVRLDSREPAVDAFEALLRDTPGSGHVRADFAATLLQWGKYDHAWRVLGAQPDAGAAAVEDGSLRRLDLLRLQWLNFEGRYGDALRLVESLEARYPDDVDVRLARASFDAARGRSAQADEQYAAIQKAAPGRQDVAALVELQDRQRAPKASMQLEARDVTRAWSSTSTLVSVEERLSRQVPVTVVAERLDLTARQVLTADGGVGALSRTVTRFEAGLAAPLAPGINVTAALFGTGSGAGAGGSVERHDLRGAWKVTADYGRPFWELVESAAGDGRKDRLGLQRDWRFSADSAGWAVLDLNRYRLPGGASASTTALTLGFIRTVRHASPTLTLQYGVDTEHVRETTRRTALDGRVFSPIPLVSREVHLAGVVTRFPVRRLWDMEASAGYTVDRFGGRGSFMTARATPAPGSRVGLDVWGERRLYSLSTTQQALRGGARLTVRF
jgi:tetratricopeptide (TPR) repeat protein